MSLRLKDRLGLVVGVVLFKEHSTVLDQLTYMHREENGVLWAYIYHDAPNREILILNKDHTCSRAGLRGKLYEIKKHTSGINSIYIRWMTLREYKAKLKEKKKIKKGKDKKGKSSTVKRKHMKHIIADWVVEDL